MHDDYDDAYATCQATSACFRIMAPDLDVEAVFRALTLVPSWTRQKGHIYGKRVRTYPLNIWALETDGVLSSRDTRRHLDWLLDRLEPHTAMLAQFAHHGYELDLYCKWVQRSGEGGPTLSPSQMARMAALHIPIGFEFWQANEDENEDGSL